MKALASVRIVFVLMTSLMLVEHLGAAVSADPEPTLHFGVAQYQEGLQLERKEDYAGALAKYQAGLRAAEASGQKRAMAENWLGIGWVCRMWDDLRAALAACRTALRLSEELHDKKLRFQSLARIGEIQARQGQHREAAQQYEKAWRISQELQETPYIAWAWVGRGNIEVSQGHYAPAAAHYQRALDTMARQEDKRPLAEMLDNIARAYWGQGLYAKSVDYYKQALALQEALGDRWEIARALTHIGLAYRDQGSYDEALACYQRARKSWEDLGDPRAVAWTSAYIGIVYWEQGAYEKAIASEQSALQTLQALGDLSGVAFALNSLGIVYWSQREFSQAMAYLQDAVNVWGDVGNKSGRARVLTDLGIVHNEQGSYGEAIACFERAQRLREEIGDHRGHAETLSRLGDVYQRQRSYGQAAVYLQRARRIFERLQSKRGLIATQINLGSVYQRQGRHRRAVAQLQRALAIAEALGGPWETVWTLTSLGDTYQSQGSYDEAFACYERALNISQESRLTVLTGEVLNRVGRNSLNRQKYAQAVDAAQRALDIGREANNPRTIWLAHYNLAGGHEKLGRPALALRHYQRAIGEIEKVRAHASSDEGKTGFLADKLSVYEDLIGFLYQQAVRDPAAGYDRQAFEYAERAKARVFLDLLADSKAGAYPQPLNLEQAQPRIDEESVLLEYLLGREASFLLVVTRERYRLFKLPRQAALEKAVESFRRLIKEYADPAAQICYLDVAYELYTRLVKPAEPLLQGKRKIIVAADGVLNCLPFEALLSRKVGIAARTEFQHLPYLVKSYAISYVPSASVFYALPPSSERDGRPQKQFLAFADPDYGNDGPGSPLLRRVAHNGPDTLKRIKYSGQEARRIAHLYKPEQCDLFLQEAATEENLKAIDLTRYKNIHFAAHGLLNENRPEFSAIALSRRPSAREDGLLHFYEVFHLKLDANLVVLSACETGLGARIKGEGLIGLARAFMYAGARSVIASLWKVDDASTSDLMYRFYRNLGKSAGKVEALREAQLDFISAQPAYAHPYYWAAFILYGQR